MFLDNDGGQAVTDTFGAYAYGIPRTRTGSDAFTFVFAGADGYQTDPNGLLLLGNRVYHVYTGRFLTRDPAGAGDNDYEYCDDNPLSYTDPLGLEPPGVTDHPGPGSGELNQWFTGDDFDTLFGGSAGSGNIVLHWFVENHGNGTTTSGISYWAFQIISGAATTYYSVFGPSSTSVANFRIPGKTPPSKWPIPPVSLIGKKGKWNSEGYYKGKVNVTWDRTSHGTGQRGNDGHWDEDTESGGTQGRRWDREGNLLSSPYSALDLSQYDWTLDGNFSGSSACGAFGTSSEWSFDL